MSALQCQAAEVADEMNHEFEAGWHTGQKPTAEILRPPKNGGLRMTGGGIFLDE